VKEMVTVIDTTTVVVVSSVVRITATEEEALDSITPMIAATTPEPPTTEDASVPTPGLLPSVDTDRLRLTPSTEDTRTPAESPLTEDALPTPAEWLTSEESVELLVTSSNTPTTSVDTPPPCAELRLNASNGEDLSSTP
jgi:hypothetical protein